MMAIVVLVLWLFTAGAGFYLLVTSNLGRARPATAAPVSRPASAAAQAAEPAAASVAGPGSQAAAPTAAPPAAASRRETRRAARNRFDPPSLVAAKKAPVVPGLRSLLEFAHPACGLIGFAFWLGYTFVHYRMLGWIAFGLVGVTACLGLTWFAANVRAANARGTNARGTNVRENDARGTDMRGAASRDQDEPGPSFTGRLIALHGGAAAVTVVLAALAALVMRG
jgi:hypothetical protein